MVTLSWSETSFQFTVFNYARIVVAVHLQVITRELCVIGVK